MKRMVLTGLLIIIFIPCLLLTWLFLLLDHIFYPGFNKVTIRRPVFIIGMPRSATTLCLSLLSADTRSFTSMKLWEIIVAPSIIQKKLIIAIRKTDKKLNNILYRSVLKADRILFRKNEMIHPTSLLSFEEDDFVLLHIFSTPFLAFLFPENRRFESMLSFDESIPDRQKKFIISFYQSCIRRHMFVFGSGKRYLAKNPSHTPRIRSLLMYFPDAKFIYMLRNPLDSIASTINMYRNYKKILDSAVSMEKIRSQTLKFADIYYNYPLLKCKDLYGKSLFICRFDEITKEPSAAIERICRLTGTEYTVPTSGPLNDKDTVAAKHKATDRYLPEDFGLDNVMIKERYSQIYREYLI